MKTLLTLFVLFFLSSVFAEDISDFEIEGISIGDSLLDYMSEKEILNDIEITSSHYAYLNDPKKFGEAYIFNNVKFKTYESISFYIDPKDKNYTIYGLRGNVSYNQDIETCLKKQNQIDFELEEMFKNFSKKKGTVNNKLDSTGKSIAYHTNYSFKDGSSIGTRCNDWEENLRIKNGWSEGLSVSIRTKEVYLWLGNY